MPLSPARIPGGLPCSQATRLSTRQPTFGKEAQWPNKLALGSQPPFYSDGVQYIKQNPTFYLHQKVCFNW